MIYMKPWMWSVAFLIPLGLAIGLLVRIWSLGELTTLLLTTVGALIAAIPIVLDEIRASERGSGAAK